jgi:hypothetical protein
MHGAECTQRALHRYKNQLLHLRGCSTRIVTRDNGTLNLEGGILTLAQMDKGIDATKENHCKEETNDGGIAE